jgi:hypothetical protein
MESWYKCIRFFDQPFDKGILMIIAFGVGFVLLGFILVGFTEPVLGTICIVFGLACIYLPIIGAGTPKHQPAHAPKSQPYEAPKPAGP